jgi:exosortase/archaeosortase family protein
VWRGVVAFLGWGVVLSFLQWGVERSPAALWLTERLAEALVYGLGGLVNLPLRVEGTIVAFGPASQEVTPNCLGLAAITFYAAALLATPAHGWERLRGAGLGLGAILLGNVARLVVLSWFFVYAFSAFSFVHIPVWGTVVPLVLVSVWGLWVVRDLQYLPAFPLRFLGGVALALVALIAAWYVLLDRYLIALVVALNAVLGVVGIPIETLRLTSADLLRYLDVDLPHGGFRLEIAGQTLNFVTGLALILASPLPLARRLRLGLYGALAIAGLHVVTTAMLIVVAWSAPRVVPVFQIANDFVSLAAGPCLWLLLTRPSAAWFPRPSSLLGQAPHAVPVGRGRVRRQVRDA